MEEMRAQGAEVNDQYPGPWMPTGKSSRILWTGARVSTKEGGGSIKLLEHEDGRVEFTLGRQSLFVCSRSEANAIRKALDGVIARTAPWSHLAPHIDAPSEAFVESEEWKQWQLADAEFQAAHEKFQASSDRLRKHRTEENILRHRLITSARDYASERAEEAQSRWLHFSRDRELTLDTTGVRE